MSINLKRPNLAFDYKKMGKQFSKFCLKHRLILTLIVITFVFGFAVLRVSSVADPDTNEDLYLEKTAALQKVKFDDEAVKAIQELDAGNIKIDPQLIDNRDNPFSE